MNLQKIHFDMQSRFGTFFSSPCQKTTVTIPSTTPEWTCGLKLSGTFNCTGEPFQLQGCPIETHSFRGCCSPSSKL